MKYPPISPTGAMSSGDYITYMLGYLPTLADYAISELDGNYTYDTINDWNDLWTRSVSDVKSQVTELTSRISDVQAKVTMIINSQ